MHHSDIVEENVDLLDLRIAEDRGRRLTAGPLGRKVDGHGEISCIWGLGLQIVHDLLDLR